MKNLITMHAAMILRAVNLEAPCKLLIIAAKLRLATRYVYMRCAYMFNDEALNDGEDYRDVYRSIRAKVDD